MALPFLFLITEVKAYLTDQQLSKNYLPEYLEVIEAMPRTASGKPNLQGFWTNASLTTMQRSDNYKDIGLVIPADRLQELTTNHHQNVRQATDDNQVAGQLPDGKDLGRGRGYNAFWVDPGSKFGVVRGEVRTSWITYPENGRIPFSEQGLQLRSPGQLSK